MPLTILIGSVIATVSLYTLIFAFFSELIVQKSTVSGCSKIVSASAMPVESVMLAGLSGAEQAKKAMNATGSNRNINLNFMVQDTKTKGGLFINYYFNKVKATQLST